MGSFGVAPPGCEYLFRKSIVNRQRAEFFLDKAEILRELARRVRFDDVRQQLMQLAFGYYRLADSVGTESPDPKRVPGVSATELKPKPH
jgi:hypothetical protein